jgi:predicted outer membrane repeat protein
MKLFFGHCTPLIFVVAGVWLSITPLARAAVDTVTTTADSGPGSLRNTIAAASPGDTIVFSPTLAGQTIQLTTGELLVGQNLTIDASTLANGITIDGGGSDRVLEIGGAAVTIDALTVTNGYVNEDFGAGVFLDDTSSILTASNCVFCGNSGAEFGGAICVYGALTLDNCIVSGNSADVFGGGIYAYGGAITINNCSLSENSVEDGGGGGIESDFGVLALNDCTLSNNFATIFGGGVATEDDGTLAMTNCVFGGNTSGTGGGLFIETTAMISGCTFSNNISTNGAGGGIDNYGASVLNNCVFSGNSVTNNNGLGGGLANSGLLTINNCALSANSALNGSGGGICNLDTLTASNCSFYGNSASENRWGGGIYNDFGELTLDNCTLAGNLATNASGGGFASFNATNVLVNCTISSNSALYAGGLFDAGSSIFALTNTIVAGNFAPNNPDVAASYFGVANFIGGNPELSPLGSYGGPTSTMSPMPGSPVIDAGTDSVTNFLASDQRGLPRLFGAHVDIGAVEARDFVVLNANDNGDGSLRAALTNSLDYVTFTNILAGQTISLTSGELLVTNTTTIDASALAGGVVIDAGKISRVLEITNADVTLNSLTLTNGYVGGNGMGGAVLVDNNCAMNASDCVFGGNFGSLGGGGIKNEGILTLSHCVVSGNIAPNGLGGGIDYEVGAAMLNDCTLSGNTAEDGGGIECFEGTLVLSNCVLSGNSALNGGALELGSAATLDQCTLSSNSATESGGGIEAEGTTLSATNCNFSNNLANECGAVQCTGGTFAGCTFLGNAATNGVGAMLNDGSLTLYACSFATNTAVNGGAGGVSSGGQLTANNCTFSGNSGTNAGAIANSFNMTLNNCRFFGNSAVTGNGGGIYNYWILTVSNCFFSDNIAANGQGGGIYNWHTVTLDDCNLVGNTATNGGAIADGYGGGDFNGSTLTVNDCAFFGSSATNGGGIFNAVNMALNNCTFYENSANSGFGGAICSQSAGAIYGYYPTNLLVNCTICDNNGADGGGLYSDSSSILALTNTIVAGNSAGTGNDINGSYSGVANFIGGNPHLATLGNNGGSTLTMPPEFGSPVIDAGSDWVTNLLATDQRGFPRLAGAHVDIGAVEAQTAPANDRPVLQTARIYPNGIPGFLPGVFFGFSFTNAPDVDFTVLTSTNLTLPLAQWTALGNAAPDSLPGQYEFFDQLHATGSGVGTNFAAAFNPRQFYRVVSP